MFHLFIKEMFTADVKPSHKMCSVYHDCPFFLMRSTIRSWTLNSSHVMKANLSYMGYFFRDKMELALLFTLPLTHEE